MRLVVSDAHDGLVRAISEVYPEASWQRCVAHVKRDVLRKIDGKTDQRRASAAMGAVFAETDPVAVRALYHQAVDAIEEFAPEAARVLEDVEHDASAYLSFPCEHRVKIRTNNVMERMNAELKRRAKVVQSFPNEDAVMRLLGGIVDEIYRDWESGSRFMSEESLRPVLNSERMEDRFGDFEPDEDARRAAKVVMKLAIDKVGKAA